MPLLSHCSFVTVSMVISSMMSTGSPLDSGNVDNLSQLVSSSQIRPTFEVSYKAGNISWASGFRYDANDVFIGRINYGPGADRTWHTDDDDVTGYGDNTYDARGNPTRQTSYRR